MWLPVPRRPVVRDRLLAVALAVPLLAVYGPWPLGPSFHDGQRWPAAVAAIGGCALLAWRRSRPLLILGVLGACSVVSVGLHLDSSAPLLFSTWFAIYGVPAFARPRLVPVTGVLLIGAVAVVLLLVGRDSAGRAQSGLAVGVVFTLGYVVTAWLLGRTHRLRTAYLAELEERAARLARERESVAARATAEERARIARELHDMLAHTMSGMVVLAGGARRLAAADPARAAQALDEIERAGRRGMAETRLLLDALNDDGADTPALRDLPALAARMRDLGLPVEVTVNPAVADLPPAVEVAVYRIVRESLTNCLRHAGPATARVELRCDADTVDLAVLDDGSGGAPTPGSGHGVAGMRERARLLGGELHAGPEPDAGWGVRARLPLRGPEPSPVPHPSHAEERSAVR